jgi:hypothetical protein
MMLPKFFHSSGLLILFLLLALSGCEKYTPPPEIFWILPDGTKVGFYHERSTDSWHGDHNKCVEVTHKNERTELHTFGGGHNGYEEVDLRLSGDGRVIWILDRRQLQIGMSYDLSTREFRGENNNTLPFSKGTRIFVIGR